MTGRCGGEVTRVEQSGDMVSVRMLRSGLNDVVVRSLTEALDAAERSPGCRTFALIGGDDFCRGLDLTDPSAPNWLSEVDNPLWAMLTRLSESPLVTIAVVTGRAEGGGVGLAAACDLVVAAPGARFRLPEVSLGLVPAVVLPFLARRVGGHRAFELALTSREVDQNTAVLLGLADLAAEAEPGLRAARLRLRRGTPDALRDLKRYRDRLFPLTGTPQQASELLRARFAAPSTSNRLTHHGREGSEL